MTSLQWISVLGALAALVAASFWLISALMRVPAIPLNASMTEIPLARAVRRQSRFSTIAALFAILAAVLSIVAVVLQAYEPANKFEQGALLLMQKKIDAERVKLGQERHKDLRAQATDRA